MTSLFSSFDIAAPPKTKKNVTARSKEKFDVRLGERYQTVSQAIGPLQMGKSIHFASMGEWSNHELLQHILDQTGPAELFFSTWSVSEDAIRQIIKNFTDGLITALTCVLDWRVKVRRPKVLQLMNFNFSKMRLTSCHAKVFVVSNKNWQVAVLGSANFTNNPRIEAGVISCDPDAAEFHKNWIKKEYEKADPFNERNRKC